MIRKVRANAMYFAILVSVIILLVISGILLLISVSNKFSQQTEAVRENITKVNERFLENSNAVREQASSYWGGYRLLKFSEGNASSQRFENVALKSAIEFHKEEVIDYNFYLTDQNMPLVMAGNSELLGKVSIPEKMLKRGSINGKYFIGKLPSLLDVYKSEEALPELKIEFLRYIEACINGVFPETFKADVYKPTTNSFLSSGKILDLNKKYVSERIAGNIILYSRQPIFITSGAILEDILIVAPKITIEKGFTGSVHLISEKVLLRPGSYLSYPSSISIIASSGNNNPEEENLLELEEDAVVEGNVILIEKKPKEKSRQFISIHEGAEIEGWVYNESYTELSGMIKGHLYTQNIAVRNEGSVYLNHLFNGSVIPSERLKTEGISLSNDEVISKWLY